MKKCLLIAAIAATPALCAAAEAPAADNKEGTTRAGPTVKFSQDKLDRIRRSLVAQIAVWDAAEQAMRAPTPDEAAALALKPSGESQTAVPLAGGGVALRADVSQASLAVAVRGEDGKLAIGHGTMSKNGAVVVKKEAGHAH